MRSTSTRGLLALLCLLLLHGGSLASESVVNSPHNLSVSGPGSVRALSEDRVCVFCHTPHGARTTAPLWNRQDSNATYQPYDSPTITAKPGQPTGTSKLCLSCHDGTVALGDLVSEATHIATTGSGMMPPGRGRIGTDLRDDHPISFAYAESLSRPQGELAAPHAWDPAMKLDPFGMLQCTTCHDPHNNQWEKFLVLDNTGAALCRECHRIDGFDATAHATAGNTWSGAGRDPWPHTKFTNVAANACMNCHQAHHAPGAEALRTAVGIDQLCLNCHDGSVSHREIMADFRKPYRHPVIETSSSYRPGQMPNGRADSVSCVDCHNPHKSTGGAPTQAPEIPALMAGASGMTVDGVPVPEAIYEYEVCFKCHSETSSFGFRSINRQVPHTGIRQQFSTASPSFHPVTSIGMNPDVPSLIAPLNEQSQIYCTHCHGGDAPVAGSGSGDPRAPHGSRHRFLLTHEYQTGDLVTESPSAYALCYSCHDRSSILGDQSFAAHRLHIVNERTPCSVCHDAHGIDPGMGNPVNNAHLINFDLSVVQPLGSNGILEFTSQGIHSGNCTLTCHGRDHFEEAY